MPTTMMIPSVTMWTHHTQLKETTKCNNRCVVATDSGPIKIKLKGSIIMVVLFCLFGILMGKAPNLHKPGSWSWIY